MGSNCCKGDAAPIRSTSSIYTRSRGGVSLDDRFTTSDHAGGGVRLTVSSARTGDSGVYTLQASNAAGSGTARVRLEVSPDEAPTGEDPPTFLRRLQDLTVKVGTRTRFLVEIVSSTECKVTWYRNERRLMESERVALVRDGHFWCADVATVSVDDAGRWTCTAENAGGRASCSAHLNVLVPKAYKRPEFVEELRALLTEQGTVSLECKVIGVPTPVLRWFKDSREIKAGDVFALTASAEDPTSLGTYTCEAVNCMGRGYSSSKVHVVGRSREGSAKPTASSVTPEPPPIFTKELESQSARIGAPLTFTCHIVVPPWPRSLVWYNKQGKVEPGERYHVLEDGVGGYLLEVVFAEWADEGEWKCVATSAGGRVGISTCHVDMEVPKNYRKPRFMENLQAVLTEEGLVSFECKVVGFPTPVLSWFKDGQELKPGDVYQLTGTNSLGSYCCIARNCMGQASSSAELTVEDIQNQLNEEEKLQLFAKNQAPKFVQALKSVEAKIDEPFRFTIKVAIPPEPAVLWYRDDQPVDESPRCHHAAEERGIFHLDIQNLEFPDQAEWKCVATNDFGHSVTSCFLKLIIPRHYKKPRFLENLQAILSEEGAVNLECKVIGVPQPVLKWYKDGEELKPGDIHRIISGQDGTCCLGTYTCEARNCMGIASSSASLLGFDDSMKAKKRKEEEQALQRNLSLSTIHEERTSQMYDTPVGDITLDDRGEISFSFDGKEVSVSLYETPDLTEEEALQIVEMYADQLSENVTEHNVVELPPLRFVKETSTSGNLLMEAIIIDVSPEYFVPEEDLRTEADVEDMSIADENGAPQLSLDTDIVGEDYLEKTMALLSDEKGYIPRKPSRLKSDSGKSGEDFFSLSREQSLSEGKGGDDTQVSESFASAKSSAKVKSKSPKPSDGKESTEITNTVIYRDEASKRPVEPELVATVKPKRERRTSRGSRRSSSGSEKSLSRSKEEPAKNKSEQVPEKTEVKVEPVKKPKMSDNEFKSKMTDVSYSLSKVINDVQIIERDIILKSELMSSAATASRSLEIISSLITPLSEMHSIADVAKESILDSKEVSSTIFNSLPKPLKELQQSLTIVEKCIDVESENKTLVKRTCVAFIENCGIEMQKLLTELSSVTSKDCLRTEDKILSEINNLLREINKIIKYSADIVKAKNILSEFKPEVPSVEAKHLRDTQRAVFELRSPLNSLLCIAKSAESGKLADVCKVSSEVILTDMSASIQDLQTALEQIESLSVKESATTLHKYNTEIIETVMESILKLRNSFEQLSPEARGEEDQVVLKGALGSIEYNLTEISTHIDAIENRVGTFDILQSENKLEVLQKMAQILIALESNIPRLESVSGLKSHIDVFHKNLTKVLENVIESNESKKYFALMEICGAVNRVNNSIKNLDSDAIISLASLSNTLTIIQDQFVKNLFDTELNCSVLRNISDTLFEIQEAVNHAEESSMHIDSEHIQDLSMLPTEVTRAAMVVEHIEQTIAAIASVKLLETAEEFALVLTPAFENISPILEELKRCVASALECSVTQEEHISDISNASLATSLATPISKLNQNIVVLNQMIVENIVSIKDKNEVMSIIAEPLHELHTTLEIFQQDVISQYTEDISSYDVSLNVAKAVQCLQSCIIMIQEQAGVEIAEEISTLEDISGIKTTAETLPSDRLVLPIAEKIVIEESVEHFDQDIDNSATAQALQSLNEHITVIQTPEIIDALDSLSEISDYSSLKSIALGLGDLRTGIEEVLHPVVIEYSEELKNFINTSRLVAIAEPMQELQQSLSVLDTSNIPVYEHILEMPTERIHSVLQSLSAFKKQLDKCIHAVFPAMETADKTIEISNKVETLRDVCENLKAILNTIQPAYDESPRKGEVIALESGIDRLLDATDVSKGIKIDQVRSITEELYQNILTVQEEVIQFTPFSAEKLSHEAKMIQAFDEIENNIAVLEQYDFVDLSKASDITSCTSPQLAMEMESDSLMQMGDIAENAVILVQNSAQNTQLDDLMIIEHFFETCKNEFTILRCLMTKQLSHKKIIRLLQEFVSLQNTIYDFRLNRPQLNLSEDIEGYLTTFLIHADDCMKSVQHSLLKIVNTQVEILVKTPCKKLEVAAETLKKISENKKSVELDDLVLKFIDVIEKSNPCIDKLEAALIEELQNPIKITLKAEDILLAEKFEEISQFIACKIKSQFLDSETKYMLEDVLSCLHKHEDYKDASGTGKTLIILKCLAECSDILQEKISEGGIVEDKIENDTLRIVLSDMLEPLQALHNQLTKVQEQIFSGIQEKSIFVDTTVTESFVQAMSEVHKEIQQIGLEKAVVVDPEEISLIMEVDKEIHSIQDTIRSLENVQTVQVLEEISKPIDTLEKSLQTILGTEKVNLEMKGKLPAVKAKVLVEHIDQFIELIEIVEEITAVIKIDDLKQTMDIARELRESISSAETAAPTVIGEEAYFLISQEQEILAQRLQKAISALQVQVYDNAQELALMISTEIMQRFAKITSQLEAGLVAVTGVQVAVHAPAQFCVEHADSFHDLEKQVHTTVIAEQISAVEGTKLIDVEQVSGSEDTINVEDEAIVTAKVKDNLEVEASSRETTKPMVRTLPEKEVLTADVAIVPEDAVSDMTINEPSEQNTVDPPREQERVIKLNNILDHIDLVHHIEEFISNPISEVVEELFNLTHVDEVKESMEIAKELRSSIVAIAEQHALEVLPLEEARSEQTKLAQKLQNALSMLQTEILESAAEYSIINAEALQQVSESVTHLQDDLRIAIISYISDKVNMLPEVEQSVDEDGMKQLEILLQEVSDKIDVPAAERNTEDNELLRDTLDEVQTVIIKLKRDCDGAGNDTLNETLEDLECSVRSVQLQINEDSPPELLKEACATLQLLVNNMNETQEVNLSQTITKQFQTGNVIDKCSTETEQTVNLLEIASNIDTKGQSLLGSIVSNLNNIKNVLKSLRLNFLDDATRLIENGIEVVQTLDQLEEKIFLLEKDIEAETSLDTTDRDSILTAVHSVYGSISNMRGTMTSIQKQYMHENYGKPSDYILRSIKNISAISKTALDETKKFEWKKLSKSLRNVLNHFEDVKFYVNLDKTARLPSDAAFTKIILTELRVNFFDVITPQIINFEPSVNEKLQELLKFIDDTLLSIEPRMTLEVKEKIPMFKNIAARVLKVTDSVSIRNIIKHINDVEHEELKNDEEQSRKPKINENLYESKETNATESEIEMNTAPNETKMPEELEAFDQMEKPEDSIYFCQEGIVEELQSIKETEEVFDKVKPPKDLEDFTTKDELIASTNSQMQENDVKDECIPLKLIDEKITKEDIDNEDETHTGILKEPSPQPGPSSKTQDQNKKITEHQAEETIDVQQKYLTGELIKLSKEQKSENDKNLDVKDIPQQHEQNLELPDDNLDFDTIQTAYDILQATIESDVKDTQSHVESLNKQEVKNEDQIAVHCETELHKDHNDEVNLQIEDVEQHTKTNETKNKEQKVHTECDEECQKDQLVLIQNEKARTLNENQEHAIKELEDTTEEIGKQHQEKDALQSHEELKTINIELFSQNEENNSQEKSKLEENHSQIEEVEDIERRTVEQESQEDEETRKLSLMHNEKELEDQKQEEEVLLQIEKEEAQIENHDMQRDKEENAKIAVKISPPSLEEQDMQEELKIKQKEEDQSRAEKELTRKIAEEENQVQEDEKSCNQEDTTNTDSSEFEKMQREKNEEQTHKLNAKSEVDEKVQEEEHRSQEELKLNREKQDLLENQNKLTDMKQDYEDTSLNKEGLQEEAKEIERKVTENKCQENDKIEDWSVIKTVIETEIPENQDKTEKMILLQDNNKNEQEQEEIEVEKRRQEDEKQCIQENLGEDQSLKREDEKKGRVEELLNNQVEGNSSQKQQEENVKSKPKIKNEGIKVMQDKVDSQQIAADEQYINDDKKSNEAAKKDQEQDKLCKLRELKQNKEEEAQSQIKNEEAGNTRIEKDNESFKSKQIYEDARAETKHDNAEKEKVSEEIDTLHKHKEEERNEDTKKLQEKKEMSELEEFKRRQEKVIQSQKVNEESGNLKLEKENQSETEYKEEEIKQEQEAKQKITEENGHLQKHIEDGGLEAATKLQEDEEKSLLEELQRKQVKGQLQREKAEPKNDNKKDRKPDNIIQDIEDARNQMVEGEQDKLQTQTKNEEIKVNQEEADKQRVAEEKLKTRIEEENKKEPAKVLQEIEGMYKLEALQPKRGKDTQLKKEKEEDETALLEKEMKSDERKQNMEAVRITKDKEENYELQAEIENKEENIKLEKADNQKIAEEDEHLQKQKDKKEQKTNAAAKKVVEKKEIITREEFKQGQEEKVQSQNNEVEMEIGELEKEKKEAGKIYEEETTEQEQADKEIIPEKLGHLQKQKEEEEQIEEAEQLQENEKMSNLEELKGLQENVAHLTKDKEEAENVNPKKDMELDNNKLNFENAPKKKDREALEKLPTEIENKEYLKTKLDEIDKPIEAEELKNLQKLKEEANESELQEKQEMCKLEELHRQQREEEQSQVQKGKEEAENAKLEKEKKSDGKKQKSEDVCIKNDKEGQGELKAEIQKKEKKTYQEEADKQEVAEEHESVQKEEEKTIEATKQLQENKEMSRLEELKLDQKKEVQSHKQKEESENSKLKTEKKQVQTEKQIIPEDKKDLLKQKEDDGRIEAAKQLQVKDEMCKLEEVKQQQDEAEKETEEAENAKPEEEKNETKKIQKIEAALIKKDKEEHDKLQTEITNKEKKTKQEKTDKEQVKEANENIRKQKGEDRSIRDSKQLQEKEEISKQKEFELKQEKEVQLQKEEVESENAELEIEIKQAEKKYEKEKTEQEHAEKQMIAEEKNKLLQKQKEEEERNEAAKQLKVKDEMCKLEELKRKQETEAQLIKEKEESDNAKLKKEKKSAKKKQKSEDAGIKKEKEESDKLQVKIQNKEEKTQHKDADRQKETEQKEELRKQKEAGEGNEAAKKLQEKEEMRKLEEFNRKREEEVQLQKEKAQSENAELEKDKQAELKLDEEKTEQEQAEKQKMAEEEYHHQKQQEEEKIKVQEKEEMCKLEELKRKQEEVTKLQKEKEDAVSAQLEKEKKSAIETQKIEDSCIKKNREEHDKIQAKTQSEEDKVKQQVTDKQKESEGKDKLLKQIKDEKSNEAAKKLQEKEEICKLEKSKRKKEKDIRFQPKIEVSDNAKLDKENESSKMQQKEKEAQSKKQQKENLIVDKKQKEGAEIQQKAKEEALDKKLDNKEKLIENISIEDKAHLHKLNEIINDKEKHKVEESLSHLHKNKEQLASIDGKETSNIFIYKPSTRSNRENGDSLTIIPSEKQYNIEGYDSPTLRRKHETKDKPRFISHNHKDYTMEFARPSGYRERDLSDIPTLERGAYDRSPTIYRASTIILDSQQRSSVPPLSDLSTARKSDYERRSETRHRSKAVSEARSVLSEKRSSVPRDIKRKPVFSTYLTDRTAVESSRVKLTCSVLSSNDPKITWYKNGVLIDNKLKYRTKFVEGLITLEVLNAVPSDSAEYSCTVENDNGSVSSAANLKVYPSFEASPIPPTFTRSIRDTFHLAENELVLECRIRGQPLPTITWMKDDRVVNNSDRYQAYYLADGVCRLAIGSPTPEDSGKYTCKAENSVWSDQITHIVNFTGKECRLSPNIATIERSRFNRQSIESRRPHFTNVLTDYKVPSGGTIGFQVEIRGSPTRVEWLREGRSVTEAYGHAKTYIEHGLYTLALPDVTEKETGIYTCRAWSSHGTVDMNAAITVVQPNELEGKPAIIVGRPEKDVLISVGEDLNISFRVQGEPKPKVVFMKGIRDITNSQRVCKMTSDDYVKFTLKRSGVSDAGTYCIFARNAYGCDRAFVTVVVRQRASSENLISDWTYPIDDSTLSIAERQYRSVPDRVPGEPSVVDGGNNWVSITWPKPDPRASAPVLAYRVESWLLGKEGGARWLELGITPLNSFDAFNLKQGEEYHFRITPRNRYGWGEAVQTSSPVSVGLAGDRPEFTDILPGQLKVLLGETANLTCSVQGKPTPEVIWMKNGHEVEEEARVRSSFDGFHCRLTIEGIRQEDEARYSCEASNAHGRASTYARLAVVADKLIWEADAKLKRERSAEVSGEFPPQFTMRLRDRRVQATYPVRLTCQVVGQPSPTVVWTRDGEALAFDSRRTSSQDEHFHTLEIAPTTLDDGGVYEATARNSCGAVSCRCCLVVDKGIRAYVAPEFCCGLEPLYRLREGDELRISAVVEAYPSVGVTWYRDGVRLRPSRRAVMTLDRDGQIELALASMTIRDAGVYTCTASNEVGCASTSGKVEVTEGDAVFKKKTPPVVVCPDVPYSKEPMFTRKPRSSDACEGDNVIIECEVVGDPKPDVYWLRDFLKPDYYRDASHFKRVGNGPEYRFEIPHAKLDYTGAYSVVARNIHGEAKAIISLQIKVKDPSAGEEHNVRYGVVETIPRFERNLTDLLSCDGDAVEFECRVSGSPMPDIRWLHYNEVIRDCDDFESSCGDGTVRLRIRCVAAEDEGTYTCEASNNLGKVTSSACLVVYPPGEPNTLSQRLRRPPALLSAASTPRSTPRSTPARSLSMTPGPERRLCSLSGQMAPKFYTYPFNKVVEEGECVTFKCAVQGLPSPWATWDKDGVIVTPSSRITIKEKDDMLRILEIEQVTTDDVGLYRITIENDLGAVEATARLEVITQQGKFYAGVRAYSASPRRALGGFSRRRAGSRSRFD